MQALCLIAFGFFATEIEVLENDDVSLAGHCELGDGGGNFLCQFVIQATRIFPERLNVLRTMFTLVSPDAVKHMPQMVFFTGEVDKLPCQDSSI